MSLFEINDFDIVRKVGLLQLVSEPKFYICRLTYDISLCFCVPMANATFRLSLGMLYAYMYGLFA